MNKARTRLGKFRAEIERLGATVGSSLTRWVRGDMFPITTRRDSPPGERSAMAEEVKQVPTNPAPLEVVVTENVKLQPNPNAPIIYANAFALGLGNADTHIDFALLTEKVATVHLSYTLAKTLHQRLGQLIAEFEARVERPMLTTNEVDAAFIRERPK